VVFIVTLDREHVFIRKTFLSEGLCVGVNAKSKEELLIKGNFENIFPEDELYVYGSMKEHPAIGRYFETIYYREVMDVYWYAKWLRFQNKYTNQEIAAMLSFKKHKKVLMVELSATQKFQLLLKQLQEAGTNAETLALIVKTHQYKLSALFEDPYKLLKYVAISPRFLERWIQEHLPAISTSSKQKYAAEQYLEKSFLQGHLYLPHEKMHSFYSERQISPSSILWNDPLEKNKQGVYLTRLFQLEDKIARAIKRRLSKNDANGNVEQITEWEKTQGISLANNQRKAVLMVLRESFSIVTGGPGVGKTTVCRCMVDVLKSVFSITLAAPTGRAAKRAQEATGIPSTTIHRLLQYDGQRFFRNRHNPIETDVLIIDEASMIDAHLMEALLDATLPGTKWILIGDVDQLPSIGAGQILADCITSGVVPCTKLTDIFRQAADSPIISCAYAVNRGEMPSLQNHPDFTFIECLTDTEVFEKTVQIGEQLYRHSNAADAQILIPVYAGSAGIDVVNHTLQLQLNPLESPHPFRLNDKVIQVRNDYRKEVFNGDIGKITNWNEEGVFVAFALDKTLFYKIEEFTDLQISFACTVHRAQGSEYSQVIIPIAQHYESMLQKNLLYTAITRTRKKCWLIYQPLALQKAVSLESMPPRYTQLNRLLLEIAS
jgi:RecD/TraA family predicted helicase